MIKLSELLIISEVGKPPFFRSELTYSRLLLIMLLSFGFSEGLLGSLSSSRSDEKVDLLV